MRTFGSWLVNDGISLGFEKRLEESCGARGYRFLTVALRTQNRVVHSGCAVNRLLHHVDKEDVHNYIYARDSEGQPCPSDESYYEEPKLHCVVSEDRFKGFPANENTPVHWSRIDNVNQCLRAFAVDGANTGASERLLRGTFETFLAYGPQHDGGACAVQIHAPTYAKYLCKGKRAALTDQSLVKEVSRAVRSIGRWCEGGIRASNELEPMEHLMRAIEKTSGMGESCVVLLLSPSGIWL